MKIIKSWGQKNRNVSVYSYKFVEKAVKSSEFSVQLGVLHVKLNFTYVNLTSCVIKGTYKICTYDNIVRFLG